MGKRIAIIVVLGIAAIGGTAFVTAPGGDSKEMQDLKASNSQIAAMADNIKRLDREFQEKVLGPSGFQIYQRCQKQPPTLTENKDLCARLNRKVQEAEKRAKAKMDAELNNKW